MSKWMFGGCFLIAAGALSLTGCAENVDGEGDEAELADVDAPEVEPADEIGSADLVSLNDASFCNGFSVKNQGGIGAAATTLRVKYSWSIGFGVYQTWTEYFSVPALSPGQSAWFFYYPQACFDGDGDCDYVMKADNSNVVWEINESNNSLTTSCDLD